MLNRVQVKYMPGWLMSIGPSFKVLLSALLLVCCACLTVEGADTTPPSVTDVKVLLIDGTWFNIEWRTDEPALGGLELGLTTSYGRLVNETGAPATEHALNVTGLKRDTVYRIRVFATDDGNNTGYGTAMSVGTTGGDGTAPGGKVVTALFIAIPLALAFALVYYHHLRRVRRRGRELPPE